MNAVTAIPTDTLPTLIDKAAHALESARTSAEVLEARDLARVAYDAAKSAGRMAKAKNAHDDLISVVFRMQADASLIEARAKVRLADEYDAAKALGEVAGHGGRRNFKVGDHNVETTAADLGLRRDEIHDARKFRDAEKASPGLAERALNEMVEARQEPTRAALRRSVLAAVDDARRGESRKSPHQKKCAQTDRVNKFAGLCRSLSEFSDEIEQIAAWDRIPQTAAKLPEHVRNAAHVLSQFMEAQDA